jgi:large subunit ribosomal protein L10
VPILSKSEAIGNKNEHAEASFRRWFGGPVKLDESYAGDLAVDLLLHFVRTKYRMAISQEKKRQILAKLKDAFTEATSVAFVSFTKLTVKDASQMRKTLKDAGVSYYVAKKTLIRKALEKSSYAGEVPELPGEVAVAWTTEDVTAPARGVYDFGKKLKGALTLVGGVFEGAFADAKKIEAIATIPPLPILRGMFVNVINSPIQGLVIALDAISKKKA